MNRKITVMLGVVLLAGWAGPAWAHVTAEDPSVPKDSETEITFSVPVEEGGHTHAKSVRAMHEGEEPGAGENKGEPSAVYNEEVTISIPRQFEVISCDKTAEWDCKAEPTKGSSHSGQAPGGTVTFTRLTKSGTTMDHLSFTVHTPANKGTYRLPTSQKLSDGDETDWNGDGVTSEHPAPTVQVTDEAAESSHDADHK
jgi:uncharacterized protein YcnI